MASRPKTCRVVICSVLFHGPNNTIGFDWDMAGESAWPSVKGAESRQKIVARKFPQYDTGLHNIGGDFIFNVKKAWQPHLRSRDWMPKPRQLKKRKLTPRNPNYQRP